MAVSTRERVAGEAAMPMAFGVRPAFNVRGVEFDVENPNSRTKRNGCRESSFDANRRSLALRLRDRAAYEDPHIVKVAINKAGEALYFSRSPLPHYRGGNPEP